MTIVDTESTRRASELQAGDAVAVDGPFGRVDLGCVQMFDEHPSGYLAVVLVSDGGHIGVMCMHRDDEVLLRR